MNKSRALRALLPALLAWGGNATTSTFNQNVSGPLTAPRPPPNTAWWPYGDSIYAGYNGSTLNAAKYSAPQWKPSTWPPCGMPTSKAYAAPSRAPSRRMSTTTRSCLNGPTCRDASTRVVTFEMCGNDGLQARSAFKSQTGTCDYSGLNTAVSNCKTYVAKAMDYINANAYSGVKVKIISNLYYPGYTADNVQSSCKDASTGATVNLRDKFPPLMATMNYWMCEYTPRQKGFKCTDNFAEFMGADYDSNGDGKIDADGLRYVLGESESSYVTRITSTLKPTIRDANTKFVSASSSYDYTSSRMTPTPPTTVAR